MSNSKAIGNNYEREFSRKLSLWLTNNDSDDVCWRDLSSGARATTRSKKGKTNQSSGDIIATDFYYKPFFDLFFIDTKSYKEFNPLFINSKNIKSNSIFNQWVKVCNDCPEDMIPFMACKIRDRKTPEFIFLPLECKFNAMNNMIYNIFYNGVQYIFSMILLEDFFACNIWEEMIVVNNVKK